MGRHGLVLAGQPISARAAAGGAALLAGVMMLRKINDPDFWTHLALGRAMARFGTPWIAEPFVNPAPVVASGPAGLLDWARAVALPPPAWPFQRALFGLYELGGGAAVSLAVAALAASLAWLLLSGPLGREERVFSLGDVGLVVAALAAARFRLVPRPEILALLCLIAALRLTRNWQQEPRWRTLGLLFLLLVGWRTVHVTWAMGAAFSLLMLLTEPRLDYWRRRPAWQKALGMALVAAAAVGAVRFGWIVVQGFGAGGVYQTITEMRPTWEFTSIFWPYLGVAFLAMLLAYQRTDFRRGRMTVAFAAALIGVVVVRNAAFSVLVLAFLGLEGSVRDGVRSRVNAASAWASVGLAAWLVAAAVVDRDPPLGVGVEWDWFPRDAAAFVKNRALPPEVFHLWDHGGYLDWAWDGRPQTFLDGRISDSGRSEDHDRILEGRGIEEVLERRSVGTVLLEPIWRNSGQLMPAVGWFLSSPAWQLIRASDSLVFVRKDSVDGGDAVPADLAWRVVEERVRVVMRQAEPPTHAPFTLAIARMRQGDEEGARRMIAKAAAADPATGRFYAGLAEYLGEPVGR